MLDGYEKEIRDLVRRAETPVLGLLGRLLSADVRAAVSADLQVMPGARAFSQRLEAYPALFGVWLAEHVMLSLGQDGRFSIYPHVQKAIGGMRDLSPDDRYLLWQTFRRAMFKLGIQPLSRVSGTHFMVDEYVRQAGVPIAFADDLATRMLQVAKRIGIPYADDHEDLIAWQSALLNKLQKVPFSVIARQAVERDAQAYYTRAFLRVYNNGGQATSNDTLELALANAFRNEGASRIIKRVAIPQFLYRDGILGVLFPSNSGATSHEILCDKISYSVRIDEQGAFFPLPKGLHKNVEVLRADGERILCGDLWPDLATNRLLIFTTEGRLRASAQLGQKDSIEFPPGRYVALCRFAPANLENWEEVSEQPKLVEVWLDIRPGAEVVLVNGVARVVIVGHNLPSFSIEGIVKESLERVEFHYGSMLVSVDVPLDWRQGEAHAYELRIASDEHRHSIPIFLNNEGKAREELSTVIRSLQLAPGLRRLAIELARVGEARSFQRQTLLYWVGLSSISYGLTFTFDHWPENLITSSSLGLNFSDASIEFNRNHGRKIRMVFDMSGGRLVYMNWHRPGLFVEVEIFGNDGTTSFVSRPLGTTETVSLISTKNIIVSASDPGWLILGSMRKFVDFSQRPTVTFPASFLASRLEHDARTLIFETKVNRISSPILILSRPHVVTKIFTHWLENIFEIRISVNAKPTDVNIIGKNIFCGRQIHAKQELVADVWCVNELARMQTYTAESDGLYVIYISIDAITLPSGIWILEFGACIDGVWEDFEGTDEGYIAVTFSNGMNGKKFLGVKSFLKRKPWIFLRRSAD